jgi:hypothetical protein
VLASVPSVLNVRIVVAPVVLLVLLVLVALPAACDTLALSPIDPEREAARARLGPENPAVPIGPLHRPGQPCVVCHAAGGDAEAYTVAGTIYRDNLSLVALADVDVVLVDGRNQTFTAQTNCAGNFYVRPAQFTPTPPLWVSLRLGTDVVDMESPIQREWSCAGCHSDPAAPASAGPVFLVADELAAARITPRPCRAGEERAP